jgi:hypothetical protein
MLILVLQMRRRGDGMTALAGLPVAAYVSLAASAFATHSNAEAALFAVGGRSAGVAFHRHS